jgi:hypothetical protein
MSKLHHRLISASDKSGRLPTLARRGVRLNGHADHGEAEKGWDTAMSRTKSKNLLNDEVVAIRIGSEWLEALDQVVAEENKKSPWLNCSRADIIRKALYPVIFPPKKEG